MKGATLQPLLVLILVAWIGATQANNALKSRYVSSAQSIEQTEKKLSELELSIHQVNQKIKQSEKQLDQVSKTVLTLQQKQTQHAKLLKQQLIELQKMRHQSQLKSLFNPNLGAERLRLSSYYDELRRQHIGILSVLKQNQQAISDSKRTKQLTYQQLVQQKQRLTEQYARLKSLNQQRSIELARLNKLLQQQSLKEIAENVAEEALQASIEKVQKSTVNFNQLSFKELKGKLLWPTQGRFAAVNKPFKRAWRVHHDRSQEVRAIAAGTVVLRSWIPQLGLMLIIDHGGGYQSVYGNNALILVDIGEQISHRQVIAKSGQTGGRDELGLFFQLRHKKQPVDLEAWLDASLI